MSISASDQPLRRIVAIVAALNLSYFGIEFAVALAIGSVSLFADSIDFLEDASVNLLILLALGFGPGARARVGMALAAIRSCRVSPPCGWPGRSSPCRRRPRRCPCPSPAPGR